MANPKEVMFQLMLGVKRYDPEIVVSAESAPLPLRSLINFRVLDRSLRGIQRRVPVSGFPAETYLAIDGYITESTTAFWIFLVTSTKIHLLDYVTPSGPFQVRGGGTPAPIYTFPTALTGKVSTAAWEDAVYLASPEFETLRLSGASVSTVDYGSFGTVKAKHALVADDRVFYANLIQNGSKRPYRVIWSDLYTAENFELLESSEAGSYDVGFNRNVVTGLSQQRGRINIYTQNSIVQARYIGIAAGTYEFETLYNGLGNLYHYSVITAKESDFFIGRDNFYILDGGQITAIGNDIWNVWNSIRKYPRETDIQGYFNELDFEVYWTVVANGNEGTGDGELWDVCYNYKDGQWYLRKNKFVDFFYYDFSIALGITWDSPTLDTWNDETNPWVSYIIPVDSDNTEFYLHPTTGLQLIDRATFAADDASCSLETHEVILGSVFAEKEVDAIKIVFNGLDIAGTSFLLSVGTRDSFHDTVVWSTPQGVDDTDDIIVYLRDVMPGKLMRFKLTWTNSNTDYIERLVAISARFIEPIKHETDR